MLRGGLSEGACDRTPEEHCTRTGTAAAGPGDVGFARCRPPPAARRRVAAPAFDTPLPQSLLACPLLALDSPAMSTIAIVLIVLGAILLLFFVGGLVGARRRANRPEAAAHIRAADRALEQARASDRGWDRALLEQAARSALAEQRPGSEWDAIELVLVDDRPGMADDAAHLVATGPAGQARVVLARSEGGDWFAEHVE